MAVEPSATSIAVAPSVVSPSGSIAKGLSNIALAEATMGALVNLREKSEGDSRPSLDGLRVGVNLHVTKETGE